MLVSDIALRVTEALDADGVPGVAIAVVQDGDTVFSGGFGLSSIDRADPVVSSTVFQIGSVAKPITAACVLRLSELGLVDLDAPVGRYIGGLEPETGPTARMVLSHAGGLPPDLQGPTDEELLDALAAANPTDGPHYSNAGYAALGCVVESVCDEDFPSVVRRLLLGPLGMPHTGFGALPETSIAYPHTVVDGDLHETSQRPVPPLYQPAMGAFSCADDLARFAQLLIGDVPAVLSPAALDAMRRTHAVRPHRTEAGFGLGLEVYEYRGVRAVGHTGDVGSYKAWLLVVPDERCAVAVVCNRPPMFRLMPVPWRILDGLLGLPEPVYPTMPGRRSRGWQEAIRAASVAPGSPAKDMDELPT